MSGEHNENDPELMKLAELKASLSNISVQDSDPFFQESGDTLKILTDFAYTHNRRDIMLGAYTMLTDDGRFRDVSIGNDCVEAVLIEPVAGINKVEFYATKDM